MRIRTDRLPSVYTELTSITSTGTQYINTEYFWQSENVMIEAEFKVLSNSSYQSLWGSEEPYPGGDRYFAGIPHGSNGTFGFYIGTSAPASVAIGLNSKVKIKMQAANSKLSVWKNDTQVVNQATINGHINNFFYMSTKTQNSGRLYIFANHNSGSAGATSTAIQQIGSMELFSFKMTDDNKLVRNFIPAKRNSDGAIGLYETIRGIFHENIGTGTFTAGDEVNQAISYLPSTYQELDYLESTGTQYINLDFCPTSKTKLDIKFSYLGAGQAAWIPLYGERGSSTATYFALFINNTNRYISPNYAGFDPGTNSQTIFTVDTIYNIRTDGGQFYLNGNLISTCSTTNTLTTSTAKFYLFALGTVTSSGVDNRSLYARIYKCKLWEDNVLIRDLIPAKRKSDDVLGFYDCVNEVFYTNSGTGTFRYGKEIKYSPLKIKTERLLNEYQELNYIANVNGAQYLDIPFIPNYFKGFKFEFGFTPTVDAQRYTFMSNYNTGTAQTSLEINAANKLRLWANTGALDKTSSNTFILNDYNEASFEFKNNTYNLILNGVSTSGNYTCTAVSSATSMYAFLDRAKRTSTFPSPIKFYYIRIYEEDILKFNLIPCYKKADNTIGMYDIINNHFYTNEGTGAFTKGILAFSYKKFKPVSTLLPLDYQQVEYIANSGTQCINTLYKWSTNNTRIIADISVDTNSASQSVWGNEEYYSGSSRYFSGVPHGSGGTYQFFVGSSTGLSGFSVTLGTRTKIEISAINNKYCIIKDGSIVRDNFTYNGTIMAGYNASTYTTNSGNFFIFANHNSGTNGQTAGPTQIIGAMKVYSFKMYDNDVLVRDFIPCYRKSDNVIGLYDLVTRNFFVNAGTGTFAKGSNINNFI